MPASVSFEARSSAVDVRPSFSAERRSSPRPTQGEAIGFAAGTRVATPMGYVAVELLSAGDRVLTADGRHARLTWIGRSTVIAKGVHAPVRIATGVMDNIRPLRLGQGHRVRVSGWQAELLFESEAVLATAKSFVDGVDIKVEDTEASVTYVSLMFDRHEVVLAENVACETLPPGPDGIRRHEEMLRDGPVVDGAQSSDAAVLPIFSASEELLLRVA